MWGLEFGVAPAGVIGADILRHGWGPAESAKHHSIRKEQ
jgi:hypothetical protein